ncbi:MAG: UMP kinase [Candidatus Moranbacteria bacterium RBG_13_45_13]|nr:MAG: UMP kinase [Candidatus Moranbacteria bacterium RBG_13_45_13]
MKKKPKYKRILLKLSGEAMKGKREFGIDPEFISYLASEIADAHKLGVQIAIVTGGGNIFRGVAGSKRGMDEATAHYMGMLATIFNAMALQDALEKKGLVVRLQTAIEMKQIAEPFIRKKAVRHMEKGRVVVLGGGTGLPFITTDTGAAMRALELGCEAVFKATKVDGVYSDDPEKNRKAKKYDTLPLKEAFKNERINVIDKAAIELCMRNNLHIVVFNIYKRGALKKALLGEKVGTVIK